MPRTPLALLLALAACAPNGPSAAASAGGDVRVELTARRLEPGVLQPGAEQPVAPPAEAGVRAAGEAGRITVRGQMETPDPCRRLTGTAEAARSEVTLRVESAREGEMCAQVIAMFAYDAVLTGLAPGTYRLRVVHAHSGTGWEAQTALEQSVTVR